VTKSVIFDEFDIQLNGDAGKVYSYWQGPSETAFYLYGSSFVEM
jgi:hypothetical protein